MVKGISKGSSSLNYAKINIESKGKSDVSNENLLVTINFNSKNTVMPEFKEINIDESNSEKLAEKYSWIGNSKANSPKIRITSDKLSNVVVALPNLIKELPQKSQLSTLLVSVVTNYIDENTNAKNKKVYTIKSQFNVPNGYSGNKNVKLFTVLIDGVPIAKDEDYLDLIRNNSKPKQDEYYNGTCSVCTKPGKVTSNTTKFRLKSYITDKLSFASELKYFEKNFSLCEECYSFALSGENYIINNLTTFLGESLLVIPHSFKSKVDITDLKEVFIITETGINGTLNSLGNINNRLSRISYLNAYVLNLIFYRSVNASFKIMESINDIPSTRINAIITNLAKGNDKFSRVSESSVNLLKLNFLLSGYSKSIGVSYISKIFRFEKINEANIIREFIRSLRVLTHSNEERNRLESIRKNILSMIIFLYFFKLMRLVPITNTKGVDNMEDRLSNSMDREEESYLRDMQINEEKEALCRIGFLLSSVGYAQYKSGLSNNPIFNKVNFNGMDINTVSKLVIEVEEKMRQYKLFVYKNNVMDLFKLNLVLAKSINVWSLSNEENVFYIMAGYSISRALSFKKNNGEDMKGELDE